MDEDGLPIVGSGVDLTKVSMHITVANQANSLRKLDETGCQIGVCGGSSSSCSCIYEMN